MITDKQAIYSLKLLSDYALQHKECKGCIFKPKYYKSVENECLFKYGCIQDYYIDFKEKGVDKK